MRMKICRAFLDNMCCKIVVCCYQPSRRKTERINYYKCMHTLWSSNSKREREREREREYKIPSRTTNIGMHEFEWIHSILRYYGTICDPACSNVWYTGSHCFRYANHCCIDICYGIFSCSSGIHEFTPVLILIYGVLLPPFGIWIQTSNKKLTQAFLTRNPLILSLNLHGQRPYSQLMLYLLMPLV